LLDGLDGQHGVARVLPPVRVGLTLRILERVDRVDQVDHLGVTARVVDELVEPVVDLASRPEHHRGVCDRGRVARAGLVAVRIGSGSEHPMNVHALAADVADEVGDLRRCRNGCDGRVGGAGVRAAGGYDAGDGKEGRECGEAGGHPPLDVSENDSRYQPKGPALTSC
jgi:hypothetical protein